MSSPKQAECTVCGKPLSMLQQHCGNVCDALACRLPQLQQQSVRVKHTETAERQVFGIDVLQQVQATTPQVFEEAQVEPNAVLVMVVPSFAGNLEAMCDERRLRFANNLDVAFQAAAQKLADRSSHPSLRSSHENYHSQATSPAVVNACSTCRGQCCKQGGDHAFLVADYLAWRMLQQPRATVEELKSEYLERIPTEHYPDSCLFQSPDGCVLPRSIRGPTCNWFECAGIADQPTVAIARDATLVTRIGIMNRDHVRTEISISSGPPPQQ